VLRQIIGPFGLTPEMFDDVKGGNVTTQRNAEQGVFAKGTEVLDRSKDYDYNATKEEKRDEARKNGKLSSQTFVDQYTGRREPARRVKCNGLQGMNAEMDHLIPIKEIHGLGGWMKDKAGRKALSSVKDNLHYTTHAINRSKGGKAPEEALSAGNGFDENRIAPLLGKARKSIGRKLPGSSERLRYHGKELLSTGAKEAGRNALRQALGVLLHEFVHGSFTELKILLKDRQSEKNLIDRFIESLKRVMQRVVDKLKDALEALVQGGVQGFISNLLTFLINNLVTTSKKMVSVIRESTQSLWQAIKLLANPPVGMPALEVARQVAKIIAAVVTTGLGMLLEESVKGFIVSIPILVPIADVLATGMTAIMTGIAGALVVYGIDRIFDWLSSTGTELLQACEVNAEAQSEVVGRMQVWLDLQYQNSRLYHAAADEYRRIGGTYTTASFHLETACLDAGASIKSRSVLVETMSVQIEWQTQLCNAIKSI